MSPSPRLMVRSAAASRRGPLHVHNEDSWRILLGEEERVWRERGGLFAVCDGVSTAGNGRVASQLACERLGQFFEDGTTPTVKSLSELVGEIDWELRGQGAVTACTLSVLWIHGFTAYALMVGDSPIVRRRGRRLDRVGARGRGKGGRLAAFLGMGPSVSEALHVHTWSVRPGDLFVVMSDGVDTVVKEEVFLATWQRTRRPERMADELIDQVARESGQDDATAVVIEIEGLVAPEAPLEPAEAPDPPLHLTNQDKTYPPG